MSSRTKPRRMTRRRLGDMERYGLLALGAAMVLGVGVLTEELHRGRAHQRAQENPVAVPSSWDWGGVQGQERETLASLEEAVPTPGGGVGPGRLAPPVEPARSRHFDFFEPPVRLPGSAPGDPPPPPDQVPTDASVVTVRAGDTLQKIARRELGSSSEWTRFLVTNPGIDPRGLQEGQMLIVPGSAPAGAGTEGPRDVGSEQTYLVRKRDTLETISLRHYGTRSRWTDLLEANRDRIPSPEKLKAGVRIRIPR